MSSAKPSSPVAGYLSFTLHAHLPFVVNHGTWPHGIEWLHEAAAETYLPLLRALGRLQRDGIALHCNLNLSPILLEQLAHPVFQSEFPHYLERKITAAGEDEAFFLSTGEYHFAELARYWHSFFSETLSQFESLNRDIISSFRFFNDAGLLDIITCCATHGYMPLLGTDESLRAQVRTAVDTHVRHLGKLPRGIWAPECGYRPAGPWSFPVPPADGSPAPAFNRIGVEQALAESGLEFFFVDTHLVEDSARAQSPYDRRPPQPALIPVPHASESVARKLYQPWFVAGSNPAVPAVTVFPRDPRTGLQVWSGDHGYPGDGAYLDFHKKRWPGGHRYWRVTGPGVDMGDKAPYDVNTADERIRSHAAHFVTLVRAALAPAIIPGEAPPILSAPFDAELFGHWWFEGPAWLEAVAREIHALTPHTDQTHPSPNIHVEPEPHPIPLQLISAAAYLDQHPRAGAITMPTGSWGAEGTDQVWLNPDTAWTYAQLYPAELFIRQLATENRWHTTPLLRRLATQLCRELLLLESSDWQFLITTGAARDYAELRFSSHLENFNTLRRLWTSALDHASTTLDNTSTSLDHASTLDEASTTLREDASTTLSDDDEATLQAIETRDSIFPDIDPSFWSTGAHDNRPFHHPSQSHSPTQTPTFTLQPSTTGEGPRMELPKFNADL